MPSLIELGFRQGAVLGFRNGIEDGSPEVLALYELIKQGRFGPSQTKGVNSKSNLFIILSQDCAICNPSNKNIELAQIKKIKSEPASKAKTQLDGKDYNKLYLKIENDYYEVEETLLTKIPMAIFIEKVSNSEFEIQQQLTPRNKRIILDWRVLHYLREPFPDGFNKRLTTYFSESANWFPNYLLEKQNEIHSIRIYVSPEDDENSPLYHVVICALLLSDAAETQGDIESRIEQMLLEFNKTEGITCLQLLSSEDFADTIELPDNLTLAFTTTLDEFSFANAYVMREFNFQYLCY